MTSDLSAFNIKSFSMNHLFTACEHDSRRWLSVSIMAAFNAKNSRLSSAHWWCWIPCCWDDITIWSHIQCKKIRGPILAAHLKYTVYKKSDIGRAWHTVFGLINMIQSAVKRRSCDDDIAIEASQQYGVVYCVECSEHIRSNDRCYLCSSIAVYMLSNTCSSMFLVEWPARQADWKALQFPEAYWSMWLFIDYFRIVLRFDIGRLLGGRDWSIDSISFNS